MSKFRGSGRVESIDFQISQVGSGRVKRFSTITGRVGSGQEVFQISRVGSGRFMKSLKFDWSGGVMTRVIQVTRGSGHNDSRVVFGRPVGQTFGSGLRISIFANGQLPAKGPPPEGHSREPWVLPAGPKLYNTCQLLPEGLFRGDTPNTECIYIFL